MQKRNNIFVTTKLLLKIYQKINKILYFFIFVLSCAMTKKTWSFLLAWPNCVNFVNKIMIMTTICSYSFVYLIQRYFSLQIYQLFGQRLFGQGSSSGNIRKYCCKNCLLSFAFRTICASFFYFSYAVGSAASFLYHFWVLTNKYVR